MKQWCLLNTNQQELQKQKVKNEENYQAEKNKKVTMLMNQQRGIQNSSKDNVPHEIQMNEPINQDILNTSICFLLSAQNGTQMKSNILSHLKNIRREISKKEMTQEILNFIFTKYPTILDALGNFLNDFQNTEIQFESIWILNNLCAYSHIFGLNLEFIHIGQMLMKVMEMKNRFSNLGAQNIIFEKFFSFIGHLITIDKNILEFFLGNNILNYLIESLSSSVTSLRCVCLWTMNRIYDEIKKDSELTSKYSQCFISRDAAKQYHFILNKLNINVNMDEAYEFFWLLNDLLLLDSQLANYLFFTYDPNEICRRFNEILKISLITKLSNPSIRLITNLIILSNNTYLRESLMNCVFNDTTFISFLNDTLISDYGRIEENTLRDTLYLIYTLSSYSPEKIKNFLFNSLLKFAGNEGFYQCFDIMRLIFSTYYKIVLFNQGNFNQVEKVVFDAIIKNYLKYVNDGKMMLLFIDVFYMFLVFIQKPISADINNKMNIISSTGNCNGINLKELFEAILQIYYN